MNFFPRLSLPMKQFLFCSLIWLTAALRANAIIGTNYQMQLGNASNATNDPNNHSHYLIQRSVETIDYDDLLNEPNWVSWDLTAADIGTSGRSTDFYTDTNLPAGFYEVSTGDYTDSGYSRGHMCPSEDRTDTTTDNKMVFFLSNIIPQNQNNNGGPWATLETYCQSLAQAGDEILITCGPSLFYGTNLQPSGKCAVPSYTWKIAVIVPPGSGMAASRVTNNTRVIAIKIPNIDAVAGTTWQNWITSPYQIQADTGLTFFTALPPSVATVLRGIIDGTPAPGITGFSPASGMTGAAITITGTNLLSAYSVSFNGVAATSFTTNSATQITVTVPAGATTGAISVTTPGGITTSAGGFAITGSSGVGIITQPASQQVNIGAAASFTVQASGTAPLAYQWWKDGVSLTNGGEFLGATTNQLSVNPVAIADAGSYWVVITNLSGSVTSSIATLSLNTNPPVITTQPASLGVMAGQSATFSVTATGTSPLSYFWQFNGTNINGANQSTYTLSNVQATNAGNYSVVITNVFGTVTSSIAGLSIIAPAPPGLITQWNFDVTNSITSPPPSTGSGTASLFGGTTGAFVSGSSDDTNVSNSAWNTTGYPAQSSGNKTRGVQFNVSTSGYQNISISWDERTSNTGSKYYRLQYSTNGTTFVDGPVITINTALAFQFLSNSLAGIPGVDNNSNFAFRVVAEFESTAIQTANAVYDTASTSAYGTTGTTRFDMMTVSGSAIAVTPPPSPTLGSVNYGSGSFQFSVTGTTGTSFAIQSSSNLVNWTPVLTNTLPFVFTDTNLGTASARYYRAVYSP